MHQANAIAKRALCVGLIAVRSQTENGLANAPDQMADYMQLGVECIQWLAAENFAESVSENEQELLRKPLGTWDDDLSLETFWKIEALKALLWAIHVIDEMPSYFQLGNPNDIFPLIPVCRPVSAFVEQAQARSRSDIDYQLQQARFLHWRVRTELFRQQGEMGEGATDDALVARALQEVDKKGFPIEHDGVDVLVDGERLSELDTEELHTIFSICCERHHALQWIVGDDDWDDIACEV